MATPDFITALREDIGHKELLLPSVRAAVIRRRDADGSALDAPEVLLVRRSDNGAWMITSGILDPGRSPPRVRCAKCTRRPGRWCGQSGSPAWRRPG
ncbi:hypothetical protein [Nesterenkonia pannonica]|uniref:hypothetical protein n=1 Tax=Nesterenkonia pannonica TaxID=1548602 RepID=UPI002164644C|nr:hypothetical protein [Nesterenkonia pannonica]